MPDDILDTQHEEIKIELRDNLVYPGDDINITAKDPTMRKILIGVGWELNMFDTESVDVDVSCFLLDKNNQTREDSDFVFYNNPQGCGGAVRHTGDSRTGAGEGDDESMTIDIPGVSFDIIKILFVVSIYGAKENEQTLGQVQNAYIRLANAANGEEILRYDFTPDLKDHKETAVIVAALDREGPKWHFRPQSEFYQNGLAELAAKHGIIVAEKSTG